VRLRTIWNRTGAQDLKADLSYRPQRKIIACLIGIYLLIACAWQGVSFDDDSMYLSLGVDFHPSMFWRNTSWSPLYAMWIKGVSLLISDRLWCYLGSWALVVIALCSVPLWVRLRSAWVYTFTLVCLPVCSVSPYVSLFASIFLVAGLCVVYARRLSIPSAVWSACVLSSIVALVRPEFGYGEFVAAAATIFAVAFDKARGSMRPVFLKLLVVLTVTLTTSLWMHHAGPARSGMAFAQHFNYRAAQAGILKGANPWTSDFAEQVFHVDTEHSANNGIAGLADFCRANPSLFLAHVLRNLCSLDMLVMSSAVLLLAALPWFIAKHEELRASSCFLVLMAIPTLASMLLIYPQSHYAVTILPMMVVMALLLFAERTPFAVPKLRSILPIGSALMVLSVVYRQRHPYDLDTDRRSNITTIRCFQEVERSGVAGDLKMLDAATPPYADVYFNRRRTRVDDAWVNSKASLQDLLQRDRPSWIIADAGTPGRYQLTPPSFAAFLEQEMGYTSHPCPLSTGITIYTHP
jgi:hypothetical protein